MSRNPHQGYIVGSRLGPYDKSVPIYIYLCYLQELAKRSWSVSLYLLLPWGPGGRFTKYISVRLGGPWYNDQGAGYFFTLSPASIVQLPSQSSSWTHP